MLEVIANHLGEVQFEVKARNHTVYCDQPTENGGFDEGMTPPEFFLASLATCAGYYAVQYLKTRNLPMEGLQVRTTADKAKAPARLADIHIKVEYPAELDERHREGVLRAVHNCLIHNTLTHPPEIHVDVNTPGAAKSGPLPIAA
jgi:putative redox protein